MNYLFLRRLHSFVVPIFLSLLSNQLLKAQIIVSDWHEWHLKQSQGLTKYTTHLDNTSGSDVTILYVKPSCSCLGIEEFDRSIPQNGRGALTLSVYPALSPGYHDITLMVGYLENNQEKRSVTKVTFDVEREIIIDPKEILFQKDELSKDVLVSIKTKDPIGIQKAYGPNQRPYQIVTLLPGRSYRISASRGRDEHFKCFNAVLETDSRSFPYITIPVRTLDQ